MASTPLFTALRLLFDRLCAYSEGHLTQDGFTTIQASSVMAAEDSVDKLAEQVCVVRLLACDNSALFLAFMNKHANSIREIVRRSSDLVHSVPSWPGMFAWRDFLVELVKLLEVYHKLLVVDTRSHWAKWLARMMMYKSVDYYVRVQLARVLLSHLRTKSRDAVCAELGPDMDSLERFNHALGKHKAACAKVEPADPVLADLTAKIVACFR